MKNLLVPTDFSKEAQNAALVAAMLAKKFDAKLYLFHAIEATSSELINFSTAPEGFDSLIDSMSIHKTIKKTHEEMDALIEREEFQGVNVFTQIKMGNPIRHIIEQVEANDIDLVVMGTEGSSGLDELIVGSNTERVVRKASCAVLAIKDIVGEDAFKKIVFPTVMNEKESKILNVIKDFQSAFGSEVHCVWINTPNNFRADRLTKPGLRAFVESNGMENTSVHVFNDGAEEDGIRAFAHDIDAGLIAMGTTARRGINRLVSGSITEDMVNHAKRPVLSISLK